jgi:hypothetical protein
MTAINEKIGLDQCRTLLGEIGQSLTDEQIQSLRDQLYNLANALYDRVQREDADYARWAAFMHHASEDDLEQLFAEQDQIDQWFSSREGDR